jgi:hypothetical protein
VYRPFLVTTNRQHRFAPSQSTSRVLACQTGCDTPFFHGRDFDASLSSHCCILSTFVKSHSSDGIEFVLDSCQCLLFSEVPKRYRGRIMSDRIMISVLRKSNRACWISFFSILQFFKREELQQEILEVRTQGEARNEEHSKENLPAR